MTVPSAHAGGVDDRLCASNPDRELTAVSADGTAGNPRHLFVEVCFDGSRLYMRNTSVVAVAVTGSGGADVSAMTREVPHECQSAAINKLNPPGNVLLAKQTASMPIGPEAAEVRLSLSDQRLHWGLAHFVTARLGRLFDLCDVTFDLLRVAVDTVEEVQQDYQSCPKRNPIEVASCVIAAVWSLRDALTAAKVGERSGAVWAKVVAALADLVTAGQWSRDYDADMKTFVDSDRTLRIDAAPAAQEPGSGNASLAKTRSANRIPALYVSNGYWLGRLFKAPYFPPVVALDNHDFLSDLRWTNVTQSSATATGTLNWDDCDPNCSQGTNRMSPVEVAASDPQNCSVDVYRPYSDVPRAEAAYVFNHVRVRALRGHPPAALTGDWRAVCGRASAGSPPAQTASGPPTSKHREPTVILEGYGPLHLKMTLAQSRAALGRPIKLTYPISGCGEGPMPGAPDHVQVMYIAGHLVRIDIDTPAVRTLSGVGVGSSEQQIRRAYPGHISERPSVTNPRYRWLIYRAGDPAYADREILFETLHGQVTSYRVGLREPAEFEEGCT